MHGILHRRSRVLLVELNWAPGRHDKTRLRFLKEDTGVDVLGRDSNHENGR
jgi:hypothetical protein